MAVESTSRPIQILDGVYTEVPAVTTSSGITDAQKIPALNNHGVLDPSLLNSTEVSAGVVDAQKVPLLTGDGKLSPTVLPDGIGPDTSSILLSEALADGAWVNVWNDAGVFSVRNADATLGKEVNGYVRTGGAAKSMGIVYSSGRNTAVTGQVPGPVYLQKVPGMGGPIAPKGKGVISQRIGTAISETCVIFAPQPPCKLAA